MTTIRLNLTIPTDSAEAFFVVTGPLVDGDFVGEPKVIETDMGFRTRLADSSKQTVCELLARAGLTWESAVVAKLTGKAAA